jgi:hypothetical protein
MRKKVHEESIKQPTEEEKLHQIMKREAERRKPIKVDVIQYDKAITLDDALEKIIPTKKMMQQIKIGGKPVAPK